MSERTCSCAGWFNVSYNACRTLTVELLQSTAAPSHCMWYRPLHSPYRITVCHCPYTVQCVELWREFCSNILPFVALYRSRKRLGTQEPIFRTHNGLLTVIEPFDRFFLPPCFFFFLSNIFSFFPKKCSVSALPYVRSFAWSSFVPAWLIFTKVGLRRRTTYSKGLPTIRSEAGYFFSSFFLS